MNIIIFLLFIGFFLGYYFSNIKLIIKHIYYCKKIGVCLKYKPKKHEEVIDGTMSIFCKKCNKPYSYHKWR